MRIGRAGGVLLPLLLLLSACADAGVLSPEEAGGGPISILALFRTEDGSALQGSTSISSGELGGDYPLDGSGGITVSGLPRDRELLLTLFDRQQRARGAMTLSFSEGAVIDATTGEDGVGHITLRSDTDEVALLFVLAEDCSLRCSLWLAEPPDEIRLEGETGCG